MRWRGSGQEKNSTSERDGKMLPWPQSTQTAANTAIKKILVGKHCQAMTILISAVTFSVISNV
jgi:hypothetical protein